MGSSAAEHIPVLSKALAERINLPQDAVMVDATIGHGGHSLLFGQSLKTLIGFDLDMNSIRSARSRLQSLDCELIFVNENFSGIGPELRKREIEKVDFILADLGVCSAQLEDAEMGLSFLQDMPLDMRFDKRLKTTAADIVNKMERKELADLIYRYGEERASRRIARFIAEARKNQPIKTTGQLSSVVCRALGKTGGRIHPATRTFQAIRIAVNDELQNLRILLDSAPALLRENGYLAVISFHSLEDRIVKRDFRHNKKEGIYRCMTKKPIIADTEEKEKNKRSRSAKLRISQRV